MVTSEPWSYNVINKTAKAVDCNLIWSRIHTILLNLQSFNNVMSTGIRNRFNFYSANECTYLIDISIFELRKLALLLFVVI